MSQGQRQHNYAGSRPAKRSTGYNVGGKDIGISLIRKESLKDKIMGWFKKSDSNTKDMVSSSISKSRFSDSHRGLTFTVYKASGGMIVSISMYNIKTDANEQQLHVIDENKDFNDELAKIVTLESLRQ